MNVRRLSSAMFRFYQTFTRLIGCLLIVEMSLAKCNTSHYARLFFGESCLTAIALFLLKVIQSVGINNIWLFHQFGYKVLLNIVNCWTQVPAILGKLRNSASSLKKATDGERNRVQRQENVDGVSYKRSVPKGILTKTIAKTSSLLCIPFALSWIFVNKIWRNDIYLK